MRAEEIEREANLYKGNGECYVHIERTKDRPMAIIATGDVNVLANAMFNLTMEFSDLSGISPIKIWRHFIKLYKNGGGEKVHV